MPEDEREVNLCQATVLTATGQLESGNISHEGLHTHTAQHARHRSLSM
jgi:hypothetical protein